MLNTKLYNTIFLLFIPIIFLIDILFGSLYIPISTILDIFRGVNTDIGLQSIIYEIRIPRVFVALLTGLALPVSGLLMQTYFRNPLAGPDVLGISTGASLGVALYSLAGGAGSIAIIQTFTAISGMGYIISAALGSMLVMFIIAFITPRLYDSASLLIIGIMLSSITAAIVSILQYFSNPHEIQAYLFWTFGSFTGLQKHEIIYMTCIILPVLLFSFTLQKSLNALQIGENYAQNLGVSLQKLRFSIVICASLLAGIITAFTGPISFVGMAVPHIARMVYKTGNHKVLLIGSMLIGANLLLLSDLISQLPGYQTSLPINIVTACFGAPIVIWVIYKGRKLS